MCTCEVMIVGVNTIDCVQFRIQSVVLVLGVCSAESLEAVGAFLDIYWQRHKKCYKNENNKSITV